MRRDLFNLPEKRQLLRAIREAEDLTARFYCIPGREWPRYPYELKTLVDGPGPPAPAFADVVRLDRKVGGGPAGSAVEVFRIRLRDDAILAAAHERGGGILLPPLLLYVLTHELVHVVRFGGGIMRFDADPAERHEEESRVHAITRSVLRPAMSAPLGRVIEAYREGVAEPALADCASPK